MIQTVIQNIVSQMNANGDSFTFLHAEREFQNLISDEQTLPAVYLDMPIRYNSRTVTGGGIQLNYICLALFLYKSELDDNESQRYNTITKAMNAQRQFQILLYNSEEVKEFTVGECYQVMNLFDANFDAVVMPFNFTPSEWPSVCP